ncbi:MAG: YkgJ family cysteine cluster protein [Planctomycetota bacterium]|nr:YkgJ family cysteine cluster protein [Planctomycetota bacterium]
MTTTAQSAASELSRQSFQCDRCGACCRNLIVEAVWLDCLRESRILVHSKLRLDDLRDEDRIVLLWDRKKHHCPFLKTVRDRSCACAIYPTRPNVCVACEPGGPKCQQARLLGSLPVLRDVEGQPPDVDIWADDCEFDSDWLQEITAEVVAALSGAPTATV